MSEKTFLTAEQEAAASLSYKRSAVVTAAAGSGKTTLLVERILRLISDSENVLPADKLAIMTFTVNATQSLRGKLNSALQSRISELSGDVSDEANKKKKLLFEQMIALRSASISTINAFCLNIIRENIQEFDVPINFTIADETRRTALQSASTRLLMQDFYDDEAEIFSKEEREILFFNFNFENDTALFENVVSVSEKLSSSANAEEWLDEAVSAYENIENSEKKYIKFYIDFIENQIKILRFYREKFDKLISEYENEANFEENSEKKSKKIEVLESLISSSEFDNSRLSALENRFDELSREASCEALSRLLENVRETPCNIEKISRLDPKNEIKKSFTAAKKSFEDAYSKIVLLGFDLEEEKRTLPEQKIAANAFVKLVRGFRKYYSEMKINEGFIDFSDCELLLLNKLRNDEAFRSQLSRRFECIIVDEFQDSNEIQAEIFKLLGNGHLFYVGDVKQSIYAFRGGDPTIMARLCKGADGFAAFPLNKNFRSRKEIIDVVNASFSGLMTEEFGGVCYDDGNALEYGADFPAAENNSENNYKAEIFAVDLGKNKDGGDVLRARFAASLVQKYMNDPDFLIYKNGELTRPSYSDFSILLRNNGKIKLYRDALSELGISSVSPKGKSLLSSEEVVLILNYLRVIDDPLRDEELLKVMMSPLYRFSAEEAAKLRLGLLGFSNDELSGVDTEKISKSVRNYSLYSCLSFCTKLPNVRENYYKNGENDEAAEFEKELANLGIMRKINKKTKRLIDDIDGFRYFASNNSIEDLLEKIYSDTDMLAIAGAFEDSKRRVSNIRLFRSVAADFEKRDGGSLSDLLRFLEKSVQNSRDIEEASPPEDAENSVRIMTFHASKGLEAPVCILAELDCAINPGDYSGHFLFNMEHGFSMSYVDRKIRFRERTFIGGALKIANRKRPIGEELRLLYVAMTRAREKLIMIGDFSEKSINDIIFSDIPKEAVFESNVPFRWILSNLGKYYDKEFMSENSRILSFGKLPLTLEITKEAPKEPARNVYLERQFDISREEIEALKAQITAPYHNERETKSQAKFSVTELARKNATIPFTLTKPAFARGEKQTGADVGNAYHKAMEHFPLEIIKNSCEENLLDNAAAALYELCDNGKISDEELSLIDAEKIADFFKSELGKRMINSERIEREMPFYAELSGEEIDDELCGSVGIQGRVDMCFFEENGVVIVDYKTDSDIAREKDIYKKQVEVYAKVLPKLLGKPVLGMYLYSFSKGEAIKI